MWAVSDDDTPGKTSAMFQALSLSLHGFRCLCMASVLEVTAFLDWIRGIEELQMEARHRWSLEAECQEGEGEEEEDEEDDEEEDEPRVNESF